MLELISSLITIPTLISVYGNCKQIDPETMELAKVESEHLSFPVFISATNIEIESFSTSNNPTYKFIVVEEID